MKEVHSLTEEDLWKKAFDILLSKGDVYLYDYDEAIKELSGKGFCISIDEEKNVTFCEMCVKHEWCIERGVCIRMNGIKDAE